MLALAALDLKPTPTIHTRGLDALVFSSTIPHDRSAPLRQSLHTYTIPPWTSYSFMQPPIHDRPSLMHSARLTASKKKQSFKKAPSEDVIWRVIMLRMTSFAVSFREKCQSVEKCNGGDGCERYVRQMIVGQAYIKFSSPSTPAFRTLFNKATRQIRILFNI